MLLAGILISGIRWLFIKNEHSEVEIDKKQHLTGLLIVIPIGFMLT